jgi:ATP-dependent Zn protease
MKLLFLLSSLLLAAKAMACVDHDLPGAGVGVQVVEASVSTSKSDGGVLVTVLGTLKNTTANRADGVVVEAKLTDRGGKVIDVISEKVYGLVVPAGQQVAFRVQGPAAADRDAYAGVQARVVSADARPGAVPRAKEQEPSLFVSLLVSWGPMLLLIGVWVLLARRYSGKGSAQEKMAVAIGEQNALLAKQLAAIETIAAATAAARPAADMRAP